MKFSNVSIENAQKALDEIKVGLANEFTKPKSDSQCIIELKEIKKLSYELVWDFDQRFNNLMARVSFQMSNVQHM